MVSDSFQARQYGIVVCDCLFAFACNSVCSLAGVNHFICFGLDYTHVPADAFDGIEVVRHYFIALAAAEQAFEFNRSEEHTSELQSQR